MMEAGILSDGKYHVYLLNQKGSKGRNYYGGQDCTGRSIAFVTVFSAELLCFSMD